MWWRRWFGEGVRFCMGWGRDKRMVRRESEGIKAGVGRAYRGWW